MALAAAAGTFGAEEDSVHIPPSRTLPDRAVLIGGIVRLGRRGERRPRRRLFLRTAQFGNQKPC
jgi:hypothetical protein